MSSEPARPGRARLRRLRRSSSSPASRVPLGYVRLSDLADDSTSPERFETRSLVTRSCDATLVATVEDMDISGKACTVQPTGARPVAKRAFWRLGRNSGLEAGPPNPKPRGLHRAHDMVRAAGIRRSSQLTSWLQLSQPPWAGCSLSCSSCSASLQREATALRVKQHYAHKQAKGQYAGNQCPFGLQPSADGGYEHDPVYAPVVREMGERLLSGQSLNQIARWLNDSNVPTSRNVVRARGKKGAKPSRWTSTSVRKILAGRGVLGEVTSNGKPLHDETGHVITRCAPIIVSCLDADTGHAGAQ